MAIGFVCSQRSNRYPKNPPTTIAETSTMGNSNAVANCADADAESGRFRGGGVGGVSGSSAATETRGEE